MLTNASRYSIAIVVLASCGAPPITCPERHVAVMTTERCPPCVPGGDCTCRKGEFWECKPSPELSAENRRKSQQETEARLAREAADRERNRETIPVVVLPEVDAAPPPPPPPPPPKTYADKQPALREARALCKKSRRCGREPRTGYFVCKRADGVVPDYGEDFVCSDPTFNDVECETEWVVKLGECPRAGCNAGRNQCCQPGGTLVRPCGHTGARGCNAALTCRGSGGWCVPCR